MPNLISLANSPREFAKEVVGILEGEAKRINDEISKASETNNCVKGLISEKLIYMKILNLISSAKFKQKRDEIERDIFSACFCMRIYSEDNIQTDYFLVKDLQTTGHGVCFYTLVPSGDFDKLNKLKEEQIPIKREDEEILKYFDRVYTELNGAWVYCDISDITNYFMRGKSDYTINKRGKPTYLTNTQIHRYVHKAPDANNNVKEFKKPTLASSDVQISDI